MPESCRLAIIFRISDRSMLRPRHHRAGTGGSMIGRWSQPIVASAIGQGQNLQLQSLRSGNDRRWSWLPAPRQDVEDHVGAARSGGECLGTGSLYLDQSIGLCGGEDVDHLAAAVLHSLEFALHSAKRPRQLHERCTVAQGTRLLPQNVEVMQGIVCDVVA